MARKPPASMTKGATAANIRASKRVTPGVVDRSAAQALKSEHTRSQRKGKD